MSRRNPLEEIKKRYFMNLKVRKIHPRFIYHECVKCGDEFCKEPMYECEEESICFERIRYYDGCTHCFNNEDDFQQYLEDKGIILKEKDFITYNDKLFR